MCKKLVLLIKKSATVSPFKILILYYLILHQTDNFYLTQTDSR